MDLSSWLSLVTVCALGAMSPGPSLAIVTRNTLAGGRSQGLITAGAHGLGVGLYALLSVTGLAIIITRSPQLFAAVQLAGAALLIYLGGKLLRSKAAAASNTVDTETKNLQSTAGSFRSGFLIAFLNPKLAVFFLALFSQFVDPAAGWQEKGVMVATAGGIDTLWYTLIACLVSHSAIASTLKRRQHWLDRLFGSILLLIAGRLLWGYV